MADEARTKTDRELARMERHIQKIYSDATKDITRQWKAYMKNADARTKRLQRDYDKAVKSGDAAEIARTKKLLDRAKINETFQNERYRRMVDYTTSQMANANKIAVAYVNNKMPEVYAINYNQSSTDANALGVSFELIDEHTLSRAIKGEIPRKTINVPKDKRWNEKYINSQVTQGIIQGESMDKIAKRIFPEIMSKTDFSNLSEADKNKLIQRNKDSAIRAARTMVTGVENLGRLDGMKALEKEGVIMKKVWMATADDRTRPSHIDIDGEEQDLNDYFSNGCMFPGDGDGPSDEVWNCRCSMKSHIVGIKKENGTIKEVDYGRDSTIHEDAIEEERERRAEEQVKPQKEKAEEKVEERPKYDDAKTIEEAERFISQYVDSSKFGATGVDYTGVSVEVANRVNHTLAYLQDTFHGDPFGGISAPAGNTKVGQRLSGATAAYSPMRDSFYLNRKSFKGDADANLAEEKRIVADMYAHPEKYNFAKLDSYTRRVIENGKESGRTTVPSTVEEAIYHEYGHRLESRIPRERRQEIRESRERYGTKISGYATTDDSEYVAESFCCYMKGETIDPVMKGFFDDMKAGKI